MNRQKLVDLRRTINLFNISLFKNPRTYVIGFLLPIVVSLLLEFLWGRFSDSELTPPEMISFMYVSIIISVFYIGIFSSEIKQSKFTEKINIKLNDMNIIKYSMVLLIVEMSAIGLIATTLIFFGIAQSNTLGFKEDLFKNLVASVWVYYVIFGIMLGIIAGIVFLLIDSFFNKKIYSILLMSISLALMLIFSDTIIPSKIISNNNVMTVIGYFNPIKYVTWSMNLISSYQFQDQLGKLQIYVPRDGSFEPFNMLWQTTVPAIILLILFGTAYMYKKEEN